METAANFASLMILSRTQGKKATLIYVASVVITAIAFGLIIDTFMPAQWFLPASSVAAADACHVKIGWFPNACSILLLILLGYTFIINKHHNHNHITDMTKEYKINGMACQHCKNNVEKQLAKVPGVENVEVNLDKAVARVTGEADSNAVIEAIRLAGYEFVSVS